MTVCSECERLSMTVTSAYPQACWQHYCLSVAMTYIVASMIMVRGGSP